MSVVLEQRKIVGVVFDEHHGEAWSIRPEQSETLRAAHPAAASLAKAASLLAERDFVVGAHEGRPLDREALQGAGLLVIAQPGDGRWSPALPGSPVFSDDEIQAIADFVEGGGGLIVAGGDGTRLAGGNLDRLLGRFGLGLDPAAVVDFGDGPAGAARGVPAAPAHGEPPAFAKIRPLLHLVRETRFTGAGAVTAGPDALALRASATADPPGAGLLAAVTHGAGRVVLAASPGPFGDDAIGELDHRQLWLNMAYWAAARAFRAEAAPRVSMAVQDAAWARLKEQTNALRRLQEPKGEIDLSRHSAAAVRARVETITTAIGELARIFPHERAYLEQVPRDLNAWLESGCGRPDFMASLMLFRPDLNRQDGVEHLVFFPMYTPNGSPHTRFEALIVRTPWPRFVAELEGDNYDNEKFLPVQLIDNTDGYDSECAVLFPETVSLSARPTNHFGGIFCDRESARFRRAVERGAEALRIDLPPDLAALASNADLALETYITWDMIHDRWHAHGDLPFDPFMIRQRLPYWMYALEELRVDLASYGSAIELDREGFPFARYVKYGVLFDRLLRFPITGSRVRNYDGLGGQLLFGYLHKNGYVHWTDNRLLIDWERIDEGVAALRHEIEVLYRDGIDMSRVAYWIAAHDLVSRYVTPNVNSQWQKERRVYSDEADVKAWIDRVNDDEFPLSTFYLSYMKKLAAMDEEQARSDAGADARKTSAPRRKRQPIRAA